MAKNNQKTVDLDSLFFSQFAIGEDAAESRLDNYLQIASVYAGTESSIAVLSDLKERRSHIFYGALGEDLGIAEEGTRHVLDTIWEDEILSHIDPSDLQRKQEEEMRFFSFVKRRGEEGCRFYMKSSFMMEGKSGTARPVTHRIFYFRSGRTLRYALCLYNAAQALLSESSIINSRTGEQVSLRSIDSSIVISSREREVLSLIAKGYSSKEISNILGISVYTVSRHRQNIISSMNVRNSSQACQIAHKMGILTD